MTCGTSISELQSFTLQRDSKSYKLKLNFRFTSTNPHLSAVSGSTWDLYFEQNSNVGCLNWRGNDSAGPNPNLSFGDWFVVKFLRKGNRLVLKFLYQCTQDCRPDVQYFAGETCAKSQMGIEEMSIG